MSPAVYIPPSSFWSYGTSDPSGGSNGDFYFKTDGTNVLSVWKKNAGTWASVAAFGTGSGGGAGSTAAISVSGTQNGSNKVFTLSSAITAGVGLVFINGQLLIPGSSNDYVISGTTLTIQAACPAPLSTDVVQVFGYTDTANVVAGTSEVSVSGTQNSSNKTFTISNAINGVALVFLNGQLLTSGSSNDYTISGTTLTFTSGRAAPLSTDVIRVMGYVGSSTSAAQPSLCNGRLTTESGVPISTSDRTAQSTIYWTPYLGNRIALYSGAIWSEVTFSETGLALTGLTSGKNYDVFAYSNAGALALELGSAWTNDTTRATALTLQDGVLVKSGDATRRYLGTIRATGATTTEDSRGGTTSQVGGKRFVWNYYNRVRRVFSLVDTTASWNYTTNTWRQANAATGNKVEFIVGDAAILARIAVYAQAYCVANGAGAVVVGVGLDTLSAASGLVQGLFVASSGVQTGVSCIYHDYPGLGYHVANWIEKGGTGTTTTWVGVRCARREVWDTRLRRRLIILCLLLD
jgi:archaellum component FlaF (FlaF/FlaG flagellin family)